MTTAPARTLSALLFALAMLLTACGSDDPVVDEADDQPATTTDAADDGPVDDDPAPQGPVAPDPADEPAGAAIGDDAGVLVTGEPDEKPEITLPGGEPPSDLVIVDLLEGDGEEVAAGATVTTHYVGVSWLNDGEQFDASWDRGDPISFPLSGVIAGWTEGIPGMRVGGRRMLVIPPEMGYGASPPGGAIAPNDTLVFVIDLTDVQ